VTILLCVFYSLALVGDALVIFGKNKIAILFTYNFKHWIGKHVADIKFYAMTWSFLFIDRNSVRWEM